MFKWGFCKAMALAGVLIFLGGCSDTTPTVSVLKNLNGLEFNQTNMVSASLSSVPLTARCSSFVEYVEVSFDGGATWISPSSHDSSAGNTCIGGAFNMQLRNTAAPLAGMTISPGSLLQLKFRAKLRVGSWTQTQVNVRYSPSGSSSQELFAGAEVQTGGGLVLRGRLRSQSQHTSTGGSFQIRGRITQ